MHYLLSINGSATIQLYILCLKEYFRGGARYPLLPVKLIGPIHSAV